jgi:uncharacterized protein YcfJ
MNNKMLVLAAIGIVAATSLVMVGTITVHSAEASGPGCHNKRAVTAIVDSNTPNSEYSNTNITTASFDRPNSLSYQTTFIFLTTALIAF